MAVNGLMMLWLLVQDRLGHYGRLLRLDKPVGTMLLWWITLAALWMATEGKPTVKWLVLFSLGVWVMRAAGSVINDYWDRDLDGKVMRTKHRPLATGVVSVHEALIIFGILIVIAACIALALGVKTILWSCFGLLMCVLYPLMKRVTHWPQLVLSVAFNWGIVLVYVATVGHVPRQGWWLFLACALWTVMYDTLYAMADREDDKKIGIKSTAVWLADWDRSFVGILQCALIAIWGSWGCCYLPKGSFMISLFLISLLFVYQQWLIRHRVPDLCFRAFLNNQWVGLAFWLGVVGSYL